MKQSKVMSFVESTINIIVGLGVAMLANAIILPALGFDISFKQNAIIAAFMTVISIVRSFALRRVFEALHIRRPLSPFVQAVIAERFRQIEVEGFDPAHDNEHPRGELAAAGACYALRAGRPENWNAEPPSLWPWSLDWWKPSDFRRDMVRAGALVVAEGERFDRLRKSKTDRP